MGSPLVVREIIGLEREKFELSGNFQNIYMQELVFVHIKYAECLLKAGSPVRVTAMLLLMHSEANPR